MLPVTVPRGLRPIRCSIMLDLKPVICHAPVCNEDFYLARAEETAAESKTMWKSKGVRWYQKRAPPRGKNNHRPPI